MTMPAAYAAAVAQWLSRHAKGSRREGLEALSATYRKGGSSAGLDLASYLVARLPATFAAVWRVLAEVAAQRPGFAPRSLLDCGSGPGTASWAAAGIWPCLDAASFLDNDRDFLDLARQLASSGPPVLAGAAQVAASIEALPQHLTADLVIAAYALAELPTARMATAADALWTASRAMLVLVEPGTPAGFARLKIIREILLERGAVPVAPCTHAAACPMTGDDWCHFSVRLARSRAHMHAKGGSVPFEDEKFAYLALARGGEPPGGGRVLTPPLEQKPGITFRLCTEHGIVARQIARRDAPAYKSFRKTGWGDIMP